MVDSSDPDLSAAPETADTLDALLGDAARAPGEVAPGDVLLGRFRIERLIGVGGMGAVYLATDAKLERQVAVKLHHAGAGTARLHREAVAMARLAHPNAISVFEVGELAGNTFVVMEYVAGSTLRAWASAEPRTSRELTAMLIGAGQGLAAAHDAGLVHRDFKPENVLVANGRPRVGDFGLARDSQSQEDVAPSGSELATSLTRTGAVIGTPAYMAPEQLAGKPVDARADQFAFCVTAWELLAGQRPFAGNTLTELAHAIVAGPRGPLRNGRIRRVLERGLSVEPERRYANMHALLAALRRRSRWPLVVGGAVVASAAIAFAMYPRADGPSCEDAGSEVTSALPQGLPAKVLAAGGPLAADGSTRIAGAVSGFAQSYRTIAQRACKGPPALVQPSQACLTVRLRTASALLSSQLASPADVGDLVQIAGHLPRLDGCVDAATLAASPPLPAEPMKLAALADARAALDAAADQLSLGRTREARAAEARIAASPIAIEPTVAARLAVVRAQIATADDRVGAAEQLYRDGYFAARAIDDVEVSLRAVTALIDSTGNVREDHAAADQWILTGLADAERVQTRAPEDAGALYAEAAEVRLLEDRVADADKLATRAVALFGDTRSLAAAQALATLSDARCTAGKYAECRELQERSLAIARALLGRRHPTVASLLGRMALGLRDGYRTEALAMANEAKAIVDESHELSGIAVARTEVQLASIILNGDAQERFPEACSMLNDARRRKVAALGEHHPDIAQIDSDLSICDGLEGNPSRSVERLRSALAIQEATIGADSTRVADTLYNLAATLRELKRYDEALVATRRCAVINAVHRPESQERIAAVIMAAMVENLAGDHAAALVDATAALALPPAKQTVFVHGWAAMEAGRAVARTDPTRARAWLQEAREVFVAIKADGRVTEVDGLLAKLPR